MLAPQGWTFDGEADDLACILGTVSMNPASMNEASSTTQSGGSSPTPAPSASRSRVLIVVTVIVVIIGVLAAIAHLTSQSNSLLEGDAPSTPETHGRPSDSGGTADSGSNTEGESTGSVPEDSGSSLRPGELEIVKRQADDPMAIGAVDAPVVLVMWTDMRCPFCALFDREMLPVIVDEYVNTGKVRLEVHDVAYFGEQSQEAAVAARAAGAQGLFFEYTQAVYAAAPESGHADLPREVLIQFAQQVDVPDIERFKADLDDPLLIEAVQTSTTNAKNLGVSSVPFFVAWDHAVAGAQPMEVFRTFLDDAVARAQ